MNTEPQPDLYDVVEEVTTTPRSNLVVSLLGFGLTRDRDDTRGPLRSLQGR